MNELIKINFENETPMVSGRDLHDGLEIRTPYDKWFPRMCEYGFIEGEDFSTILSESTGGRPAVEHTLNLDMAKQICMIQRTEKGKEYRQYLIELEKAWNTPEKVIERALVFAERSKREFEERCQFLGVQLVEQQKVIEEMQPKASYYDLVLQCPDLIATTVIAKDYGMSAKGFNKLLRELGIQFKQDKTWVLYSKYQGEGYMKTKTHNYADTNGTQRSTEHSYWTQKGRLFLYELLKSEGVVPLIESNECA